MKKYFLRLSVFAVVIVSFTQCEAVKPYQRVYLNDSQMKMGQSGARAFEENVQAYREGAMGGGSKKNSGGCGCN